ncbi:MAG: hypothetical protein LAT76_10305 [Schleiferiaceae bacterium]|nr:hypothetical protein [Schleiferiaceae bacterium]
MNILIPKKNVFLFLLPLVAVLFAGCEKEDDLLTPVTPLPPVLTFEQRIQGDWLVKLGQYSATIDLQGFPVTLSGTDPNASGRFQIGVSPNTFTYNISMTANVDLGFGPALPLPINQSGTGTWVTQSGNRRMVLRLNDGSERVFDILLDEREVQVWQGVVPVNIPFLGSLDPLVTLTMVKES